jgi:hypothetical protein
MMSWEGHGRRSWPILRYGHRMFLEELRKPMGNLCQYKWSSSSYSNLRPEKYKL